ncbi:single-stranded-DNA-specific exonuclease RecJ, partial [Eudoraea sp.]|uniref:single-stranded-DNA-specific exonuclease RecJ n=1 Tax=Eudoraea sp. TaxID=1979955 RepID=UPI003C75B484
DYDVDGTTAVALVSSFLMQIYPNVATYIPDRYLEGYGVSYKGIEFAEDNNISLIIALDCGVKAIKQVDFAKSKGIDFIICDHHRPGKELPDATAILDPKREDCKYPYDELCGCGIGFKLIQALNIRRKGSFHELVPYLDLVATAIAADIVPMTGENRVLAFYGLQVINTNPRVGLRAIINQIQKNVLTITDVVFILAPRINAAGRIKHGQYAVNLLVEEDIGNAEAIAAEIEAFNLERRGLDQAITDEALEMILENKEEARFTSVVYKDTWHKGVIGIVASRLTESYYRPTLVFTKSGEKLAASARSVKGFDVYNALEQCTDYIEQFGGHKYAAGLTLLEKQYDGFKSQFERVVASTINPELLIPEVIIDTEIELNQIDPKLMRILKQFAPFGPGNMSPLFLSEGLVDSGKGRTVGKDNKHLKLTVKQIGSAIFPAIGFNLGGKLSITKNGAPFIAVYSIDENEWNGKIELQLKIRDLK